MAHPEPGHSQIEQDRLEDGKLRTPGFAETKENSQSERKRLIHPNSKIRGGSLA